MTPYIIAIDLTLRLVICADGLLLPITTLLDDEGEETDDIQEAERWVAGFGNMWLWGWLKPLVATTATIH